MPKRKSPKATTVTETEASPESEPQMVDQQSAEKTPAEPRHGIDAEPVASPAAAKAERQPGDEPAEQPKKKWTPAADPFGTHSIKAGENKIRLLKSEKDRAWLIRFETNPNEGRANNDPHPVLAYLKSEGFRWADSQADGKKAWGKEWQDGRYQVAEQMAAEKVFKKAAEMLGTVQSQDRVPF